MEAAVFSHGLSVVTDTDKYVCLKKKKIKGVLKKIKIVGLAFHVSLDVW